MRIPENEPDLDAHPPTTVLNAAEATDFVEMMNTPPDRNEALSRLMGTEVVLGP